MYHFQQALIISNLLEYQRICLIFFDAHNIESGRVNNNKVLQRAVILICSLINCMK